MTLCLCIGPPRVTQNSAMVTAGYHVLSTAYCVYVNAAQDNEGITDGYPVLRKLLDSIKNGPVIGVAMPCHAVHPPFH